MSDTLLPATGLLAGGFPARDIAVCCAFGGVGYGLGTTIGVPPTMITWHGGCPGKPQPQTLHTAMAVQVAVGVRGPGVGVSVAVFVGPGV